MIYAILFLLLGVRAPSFYTEENVDLIELNHFYDIKGGHVYDQVIFYELDPATGKFFVRAWCLTEDNHTAGTSENRRPIKNHTNDLYEVYWTDTSHSKPIKRKIKSRLYRESWTQTDPERENKKIHDERLRISLIRPPEKKMPPPLESEEPESEGYVVKVLDSPGIVK